MKARMPHRLDRYVARHVLLATLGVWAVLLGFDVIIDFATELKDVGKEGYSLSHAALYELFTVPRRMYTLFPTVAVIGCILGLGGLAARSELTAIRAAGVSRLQIGLGAMLPLLVMAALMVANIETVGPAGEQRAQMLASAKSGKLIMARYSGLWAREGQLFLNARAGGPRTEGEDSWIELQDVRMYQFDGDGRLRSLAQARTAEHRDGKWTLHGVERAHFLPRKVQVDRIASEQWDTELDEHSLVATLAKPRYLSTSELSSNIEYLRRNQLDATQFVSTYWGRWFYPIKVIVLVLAALPFAFGSLRSGGMGRRLFIGILIGVGYLIVERFFISLADVAHFDVRLAYTLPAVLLVLVCWGYFGRRGA